MKYKVVKNVCQFYEFETDQRLLKGEYIFILEMLQDHQSTFLIIDLFHVIESSIVTHILLTVE